MNKYNKYLKPAEVFKFDSTNYFLNVGLFLTSGWISIFIGFYISREVGRNVLKLCFKDLVLKIFLKQMPSSYVFPLNKLLRVQKAVILKK